MLLLLLLTPHITRWSCVTSSWQHGLCLVGWLPLRDAITSSLASASCLVPVRPFRFRSLTVRIPFGAQYQHHDRQYEESMECFLFSCVRNAMLPAGKSGRAQIRLGLLRGR